MCICCPLVYNYLYTPEYRPKQDLNTLSNLSTGIYLPIDPTSSEIVVPILAYVRLSVWPRKPRTPDEHETWPRVQMHRRSRGDINLITDIISAGKPQIDRLSPWFYPWSDGTIPRGLQTLGETSPTRSQHRKTGLDAARIARDSWLFATSRSPRGCGGQPAMICSI